MLVYVDDLMIKGNNIEAISKLKLVSDTKFSSIKDLCHLKYFLDF